MKLVDKSTKSNVYGRIKRFLIALLNDFIELCFELWKLIATPVCHFCVWLVSFVVLLILFMPDIDELSPNMRAFINALVFMGYCMISICISVWYKNVFDYLNNIWKETK